MAMKPKMPMNVDDGYKSGRAAMPHVMALNKNPTMGLKNGRQPPPGVSKVVAFAKGGKVCAPKKLAAGGAAKVRLKEPMPNPIKKVPYKGG